MSVESVVLALIKPIIDIVKFAWRKISGQEEKEKDAQRKRDQVQEELVKAARKKTEILQNQRREGIMPWIEFDANFKGQQLQRENLTSFIFFNKMGKTKSAKSIKIPVCESNGLNLKYHLKEEWKDEKQLIVVDLENFHSQSSLLLKFIFEDIDGNRYQQIFKKPENSMSSPQLVALKFCED